MKNCENLSNFIQKNHFFPQRFIKEFNLHNVLRTRRTTIFYEWIKGN